jgi:hypothetical protein
MLFVEFMFAWGVDGSAAMDRPSLRRNQPITAGILLENCSEGNSGLKPQLLFVRFGT